jgi:hypothetical protein
MKIAHSKDSNRETVKALGSKGKESTNTHAPLSLKEKPCDISGLSIPENVGGQQANMDRVAVGCFQMRCVPKLGSHIVTSGTIR